MDKRSPPTRGRGLKRQALRKLDITQVAPHAGAWIETSRPGGFLFLGRGRPPRGGVD